jgi:cardiolipin synthase
VNVYTDLLQMGGIGALIIIAYWIVAYVIVVSDDRAPTTTLAWLVVLFALPYLGLILYFFVGRDWARGKKSRFRPDLEEMCPFMEPIYERYGPLQDKLHERYQGRFEDKVVASIEELNLAKPLPVTGFDHHPSGEEYFPVLLEDLAAAKRFIHMQYFIWERDELTARITEILLGRLAAGVEVRIMYDWGGSIVYKKDELKRLAAAGAHVIADVKGLSTINYRNHRKITVVDGEIGHSGGVNIGQEYIDGGKAYPAWRDSGIRLTGPAVAEYQKWFAIRWKNVTGETLMDAKYLPEPQPGLNDGDPLMVQMVAHSTDDPWSSSTRAHMIAISGAQRSVRIQSPYFVPSDSIYDAMLDAALAGVDVRFMMTGWPDHKSAFMAAKSYWPQYLQAGGRMFMYEAGFFHAKTIAIDSRISAIGTMNMDLRSFSLQKEIMTWVYGEEKARALEAVFEADLAACREVTLEEVERFGFGQRLGHSSARLMAHLL